MLLSRALKIDLRMIISRDSRHLVSSDMGHCGHCGLITDNAGYNQLIGVVTHSPDARPGSLLMFREMVCCTFSACAGYQGLTGTQ